MTNPVIEEIYRLTQGAIIRGQSHVPVHVFPFRMTDEKLAQHTRSEWQGFWRNLKEGYDAFEETRMPPNVRVCDNRYEFDRMAPGEGAASSPLAACGETIAAVAEGALRVFGAAIARKRRAHVPAQAADAVLNPRLRRHHRPKRCRREREPTAATTP